MQRHVLTTPLLHTSQVVVAERALLLLLRDTQLLRSVRLERRMGCPGYRLVGRISPWWWLTLGLRHLWVRHRVRRVLPRMRAICGYTLGVEALWVI